MRISICITVFNEEKNISRLLERLIHQDVKSDEIIIVDGGSSDKTVQIIRHFQKKDNRIRLIVNNCTRSEGRNIACELANNEIIAMTDAGCIPNKNWLKEIVSPFKNVEVDISAGFYSMKALTNLEKAFSVFLGVNPNDFNVDYLPSTRSIAFRKKAWEKIGGFKESLTDTAEDTVFNHDAIKLGLKFARVKSARVEWEMPKSFKEGIIKIYNYAKGDAKSGIWFYPKNYIMSHNIKAVLILLRYILAIILIILAFKYRILFTVTALLLIFYIFWAFRKVYIKTNSIFSGLWGILIQFASDFAVMWGLIKEQL